MKIFKKLDNSAIQKLLLSLLSLIFLTSCCEDGYRKIARKHSVSNKFSKRVLPSEAMQIGLESRSKKLYSKDSDDEETVDYSDNSENNSDDYNVLSDDKKYYGYYKIGNPYVIDGRTYIPQEYESYEETGVASWYGEEFDGKRTANDEVYNLNDITAAHRTLPLPSLVRVTNLNNGKTLVVRVNDRGPFAKERIIDLSQKSADLLGYKNHGTTRVKIEFLKEESEEMLATLGLK